MSLRDDNGDAAGGNQVGMMTVGLGTHIADPAARLDFVARETSRSKEMTQAVGAKALMELSGAMPAGLTAAATKMAARMGLGHALTVAFVVGAGGLRCWTRGSWSSNCQTDSARRRNY